MLLILWLVTIFIKIFNIYTFYSDHIYFHLHKKAYSLWLYITIFENVNSRLAIHKLVKDYYEI